MTTAPNPIAIVHLDESCLGNGRRGANPGGAGGLIETRSDGRIERRDVYLHDPDTTNNRMALAGALTILEVLGNGGGGGGHIRVVMVSDSQYLVRGMREWVPAWRARNWTRKGGPIENLALWRSLVAAAANHAVQWTWVRGHRGHVKNEYANDLAVAAATEQISSPGAVTSGFGDWLAANHARGKYLDYDADAAFTGLELRVIDGERLPLGAAR